MCLEPDLVQQRTGSVELIAGGVAVGFGSVAILVTGGVVDISGGDGTGAGAGG
jgi:hypothetical protein